MLKTTSFVLAHNRKLLNDTNYTRAYINNCLIPMVNALKGHPAILTWEIFNEPEGMSNEFGWTSSKVPMSVIQRFVNLCAGAIHRADPNALVTNGAWSFYALTDLPLAKSGIGLSKLTAAEKTQIAVSFQQKYRSSLTPDEIIQHLEKIESTDVLHQNYYRDDRLVSAGNDPQGTLDFYSVHYYSTSTPVSTSPFAHPAASWNLTKPIVVAEFPMISGKGTPPGIITGSLFDTLYQLGYAGALPWSWTDGNFSTHDQMLAGMQSMWDKHRADVVINVPGAADWPDVTIISPSSGANYPDSTSLTFKTAIVDTLPISSLVFYADTTKIGTVTTPYATSSDTSFYTFRWNGISSGAHSITAIATNSGGHRGVSNIVAISTGLPPMTKFEAESASLQNVTGQYTAVRSSSTASGGRYVDIQDGTTKLIWAIPNIQTTGIYPLAIEYALPYGTPKPQYLYINSVFADTLTFATPNSTAWYQKIIYVNLNKGTDTILIQMYWGYMQFDYIALPTSLVTSVAAPTAQIPLYFSLEQNYPNPFNPATTISFNISTASHVKLAVYNVLGQTVATLVDARMNAGQQSVVFDASKLASGVYFYRLNAGDFTSVKKLMLLK